jgi:peptidoglycan/LPS O-acetylase OafA/YrhL
MSPMSAALLLCLPSIALCILASMAFLRFAERPAIRLSTRAASWRLAASADQASHGEAASRISAE